MCTSLWINELRSSHAHSKFREWRLVCLPTRIQRWITIRIEIPVPVSLRDRFKEREIWNRLVRMREAVNVVSVCVYVCELRNPIMYFVQYKFAMISPRDYTYTQTRNTLTAELNTNEITRPAHRREMLWKKFTFFIYFDVLKFTRNSIILITNYISVWWWSDDQRPLMLHYLCIFTNELNLRQILCRQLMFFAATVFTSTEWGKHIHTHSIGYYQLARNERQKLICVWLQCSGIRCRPSPKCVCAYKL